MKCTVCLKCSRKNLYRIRIKVHTNAHLCTPTHIDEHPRTSEHTHAHPRPRIPMQIHSHLTSVKTHTHPPIPAHIGAHPSTHTYRWTSSHIWAPGTPEHTDVLRSALLFGFKTTEILVSNSEKPTEANWLLAKLCYIEFSASIVR